MENFIVQFHGRQLGAIGAYELFTETVPAENIKEIPSKIYEKFQDVSRAKIVNKEGKVFDFFEIVENNR